MTIRSCHRENSFSITSAAKTQPRQKNAKIVQFNHVRTAPSVLNLNFFVLFFCSSSTKENINTIFFTHSTLLYTSLPPNVLNSDGALPNNSNKRARDQHEPSPSRRRNLTEGPGAESWPEKPLLWKLAYKIREHHVLPLSRIHRSSQAGGEKRAKPTPLARVETFIIVATLGW